MKSFRSILRNLVLDQGASEIAETAMVIPLFFMIFMAIFWFGEAYAIYGTLAHATRMGAEAAANPACTTCAGATPATNADAAVHSALIASHLSTSNLVPWGGASPKWTPPNLCACGLVLPSQCTTTQTCDSNATDVCVQENVQLSYPGNGGMGTCGTSVSARYQTPFNFPIPLTDIDMHNLFIPGQAQMRAETQ